MPTPRASRTSCLRGPTSCSSPPGWTRAREAFVGAIGKSAPQRAGVPVIALRTALEQDPPGEGVIGVPWPCEMRVLVERIEAALLDAAEASAAPTTRARTG